MSKAHLTGKLAVMYLCDRVSILPLSTIFLLDIGIFRQYDICVLEYSDSMIFVFFILLPGVPIPIYHRNHHQGPLPSHSTTLTALSCGCDGFFLSRNREKLIYMLHEWLFASAYGIVNCLIVADSLSLPFSELLISLYAPACNLRCDAFAFMALQSCTQKVDYHI